MAVLLLISMVVTSTLVISSAQEVTISTPLGKMKGMQRSSARGIGNIITFMGIPYAKSPVGKLRFAKPQPYGSWNDTLDATLDRDICMQDPYPPGTPLPPTSEDCLFLNIYVPNNVSSMNNKSVMVWIHGGGYFVGSGQMYDGSPLAMHGDVIVVTINYRLGVFGFLALGKTGIPANYGLWDQILALKWVNTYISSFGGNPSSVTIFGESAGGFSVSLLSLIPSNRGLFQRVIAQSGVANSAIATNKRGIQVTESIGNEVSCTTLLTNTSELLDCLRGKDASILQKAFLSFQTGAGSSIVFEDLVAPVVDHELFMDTPENILSGPASAALDFFRSLDMMIGNCDSEGSLTIDPIKVKESTDLQLNFDLNAGIPTRVFNYSILPQFITDLVSVGHHNDEIQAAICNKYCVHNNLAEQARQVVNMYGDMVFIAPAVYTLHFHALNNKAKNTYQYIFSKENSQTAPQGSPWFIGAPHGGEIIYIFDVTLAGSTLTVPQGEEKLANEMKSYWTNFAKYGNPNIGPNSAAWPTFDSQNRYFVRLDDIVRAEMNYENDRVSFWLQDIPKIIKHGQSVVDLSLLFSQPLGR